MARRRTTDERLGELKRRVDEWRWTRAKRTAMSAELWGEATLLANELGVSRVVRATGVGHESLRRRVDEAGEAQRASAGGSRFIELSGEQLLASGGATGPTLELEATDGTRLRLRFEAGQQIDLAAVVTAFGRRS